MKRPKLNGHAAIAEAVGHSLSDYLAKLDGEPADNLYELVIGSVEKSLITDVLIRIVAFVFNNGQVNFRRGVRELEALNYL